MIRDLFKLEAIRTVTQERLGAEVQQSRETLTFSGKPLFPIYILLPLVKLKIKFENFRLFAALLDTVFLLQYNGETV